METGTAERLTAAASYDLLRRLTEKGVISKEKFAKLCSLLRQYNQGTMLPIAENLSVYIASSPYRNLSIAKRRSRFTVKTPENCHKTVRIKGCACIFTLQ